MGHTLKFSSLLHVRYYTKIKFILYSPHHTLNMNYLFEYVVPTFIRIANKLQNNVIYVFF